MKPGQGSTLSVLSQQRTRHTPSNTDGDEISIGRSTCCSQQHVSEVHGASRSLVCIPALGVVHDGRLLVLMLGLDPVLDSMLANLSRVLLVLPMVYVCGSSSADTPRSGVGRY